jgi:hypothetical protein
LEVLFFLEELADQNPDIQKIPILYLEHMSKETLEIAKSHIEWMNNRLRSAFAYIDINPMNFKSIKVLSKEEELQNYPNPRIIVSSTSTFLLGHTRNLLPKVLSNKKSKLIFINKQLSHPLGPNLIKQDLINYVHKKINVSIMPKKSETNDQDQDEVLPMAPYETEEKKDEEMKEEGNTLFKRKAKFNVEQPIIEEQENMDVDAESQEYEIDINTYNSKLFAKSDYSMFSFCEEEVPGKDISVDQYGVHKEYEGDDLYDNLKNPAKFASEDLESDKLFQNNAKNNSVSYEYLKSFYSSHTLSYSISSEPIPIECQTAYIPFEGRIDKRSFQIILSETRPKNLIIVNASTKKVARISEFIKKSNIPTAVFYIKSQPLHFSIPKESPRVFLPPALTHAHRRFSTPLSHHISDRYSVNRLFGLVKMHEGEYVMADGGEGKERFLFEGKSLVFRGVGYRLSDLQKFLGEMGLEMVMIGKRL